MVTNGLAATMPIGPTRQLLYSHSQGRIIRQLPSSATNDIAIYMYGMHAVGDINLSNALATAVFSSR